ncbi:hypothetical protein A1QO_14135 [Vibrio genomosp. F10 str. ZF-129]|uniref:Sugar-binding protein n=1 Tax=Vibrio genomosp. F10 str. ZF-129 TaxID=1187848 RepID=A0A1E5BAX2_9VIBR|nr:RHS repeat protein [Vibrio genomosp. F10]OEE31256.1 hypothetical protein A1QO_14135 [Vibrio genomosp. F10 str. ZF-129]
MSGKISSNASNFEESISTGVDVRTGMYSININIGHFVSHRGSGDHASLQLSYSAASNEDVGFGRGWRVPVSFFDVRNKVLSLSTGQSFEVEYQFDSHEFTLPYRRLKDIRVLYLTDTKEIMVARKDGHLEYLDGKEGTLTRSISPSGLTIYYDYFYLNGHHRLYRVYDDDGRELLIDYGKGYEVIIKHRLNGSIKKTITLHKQQKGNRIRMSAILFQGHDDPIVFNYRYEQHSGYDLIERVQHATGLVEEIIYKDQGHGLPDGASLDYIPFVQSHVIRKGTHHLSAQQEVVQQTEYRYSNLNYLGNGSGLLWESGDPLFLANFDYRYWTIEIVNRQKKIQRRYNKYHLQDLAKYYAHGKLYKKESFEYFADLHVGIEAQPPIYSLAKSQTTTHYYGGTSRSFTKHYDYDDFANPTFEQNADGSQVVRTYYPAHGKKGACPVHPFGLVAFLKSETFIPSSGETPRTSHMTYKALNRLDDDRETFIVPLAQRDDFGVSTFDYYKDPEYPLIYGRVSTQVDTFNGYETKTHFNYEFLDSGLETTTSIISHDGFTVSESGKVDYFYGNPIEIIDSEGVISRFSYDALGRKTGAVVSPGTDFEAHQTFSYKVGDGINSAKQVDTKGNTIEKRFDNAGKLLEVIQSEPGEEPKMVLSCAYDNFGMMVSKTETDWLDGTALSLTTSYQYDVNGEVCQITHPDGRIELIEQNPVTLTTHYQHKASHGGPSLMKDITTFDLSGRELKKQTYDSAGTLLASTQNSYDGYGNLLSVTDTEGRVIQHRYDEIDRLIKTTRTIDGQTVSERYVYPDFTAADLPCQILVNDLTMGEVEYDGLMRLKQQTGLNSGTVNYSYSGSAPMPVSMNTAKGDQVNFSNNEFLQVPTTISVSGQSQLGSAYTYDTQTALPISSQNYTGERTVTRDSQSRVLTETVYIDGVERQASFRYSLQGKLLEKSDFFGNTSIFDFDNLGRLRSSEEIVSGISTVTNFDYDEFSRPYKYVTQRGEDKAEIELKFNSFGGEIHRQARLNDRLVFSIEQEFNKRMLLDSRTFNQGDDSTRETFFYDDLARLVSYTVNGSNAPQDEYGNTIIEQSFVHDVYGNITQATSAFDDGRVNVASFTFPSSNPQRLVKLTNTHPDYPARVMFSYDAAGNLLNDEQGRRFNYNALSQMTSVKEGGNVVSEYQYDAGGRVVSQSVEDNLIYLFYLSGQLVNEKSGSANSHFQNIGPGLSSRSVTSPQEEVHQFSLGNSQDSTLETYTSTDGESREQISRKYTPYGEG